jgi:anti-sigma factor RsiW
MHDCRKTKEDLIDLVFNEMDAENELRLLEELEACRGCRAEYHSMREAVGGFDEAIPAMLPAEEFWPEHHARIEARIEQQAAGATPANVVPFWRRAFRTSFSIPVPAAIAAAILLAATSVMAIRSFISQPSPAPVEASAVKIQYVEVPVEKRVVEERIVTRTVYAPRRARQNNQPAPSIQDLPGMTAQKTKDESSNAPRATLNGFQPPPDVKLTVIKGNLNDEK